MSTVCYLLSLVEWLRGHKPRVLWTAGSILLLVHMAAAFQFRHHWRHTEAVLETARQTREIFGADWGGGVYFNYLCAALWAGDAAWWWLAPRSYTLRRGAIGLAVHSYLAFMFFNGVVVFAQGAIRWLGVAATLILPVWGILQRRAQLRHPGD